MIHESHYLPPSQIWGFAQRFQGDYKGAITANFLQQPPPKIGWTAPPSGTYKVNVDGATLEDGRYSGVGIVIQDCKGMVVAARSKLLFATYSIEVTEALAIEDGILLAREMLLTQVIVES